MKNSKDDQLSQNKPIILEEEKKEPINQFFSEIKDDIDSFSEDTGEYFITIRKNIEEDWGKFKTSWKNMIKKVKNLDPKYRRLTKLYSKIKDMDSTVTEIKDDTNEIKLNVSQVTFMVENLMEGINDIEGYMKENLGSDWKLIKNSWHQCKSGEISKKEFIKLALSKVGKKFVHIFL